MSQQQNTQQQQHKCQKIMKTILTFENNDDGLIAVTFVKRHLMHVLYSLFCFMCFISSFMADFF
jgi:hypothetical protein